MVAPGTRHPVRQGFAFGISFAVGILLFTAAAMSVLQGISAVAGDRLFAVGIEYSYRLDLTTWGWIHIVVGALLGLTALGLMMGATWARMTAICLAALSMVLNFLSLPYNPWWAVLIIALNAVVIWAASTWNPQGY
ncbi:hypothetical protein HLB23_03515 [Nocardia uniformis]|uniref:DUF7144 domain-containing protein n=1 Tax=Nocardia uniformis TaxID=53432 RepID=A0A849C1S3_9NOCA|nr:hypothetical protein [Nocardia uniformis]NNH68949.1 hypothetical protein [Nocardia uniformis]